MLQNEKANFAVLALSPAVLCTCCSAFRGYAQGHMNMVPTGVSQVIEALCKLLLGLALAVFVLHAALPIDQDTRERLSAAGALAGVSIGAILSLCYLVFNHVRTKRVLDKPVKIRYRQYLGQSYDWAFKFDNGKMYCSELIYLIYKDQFGIQLAKPRKVSDYHILGLDDMMKRRGINPYQLAVAPADLLKYKTPKRK